jgi:hypothetical protein
MNYLSTKRWKKSYDDLLNKKLNKLLILKIYSVNNQRYCQCQCDCGKVNVFKLFMVAKGKIKSCGCLKDETRIKNLTGAGHNKLDKGVAASHCLFKNYLRDAKRRDLNFDLTLEQFLELTKQNCYYCEATPSKIMHNRRIKDSGYIYNGIDRLNNDEGYTLTNSVACCKECNYMKSSMSFESFKSKIEKIHKNLCQKL